MANFGFLNKPYVKIGSVNDICYCCHKDISTRERRDVHDVAHELKGRLENKMVFFIRKSGQDTCICPECFKEIYENLCSDLFPKEEPTVEVEETKTQEVEVEETVTADADDKKKKNKSGKDK